MFKTRTAHTNQENRAMEAKSVTETEKAYKEALEKEEEECRRLEVRCARSSDWADAWNAAQERRFKESDAADAHEWEEIRRAERGPVASEFFHVSRDWNEEN
jgi:hypothetical protein